MVPKIRTIGDESDSSLEQIDLNQVKDDSLNWLTEYLRELSKAPVGKQAAVGSISGWIVGFLSMKVGKMAATVVGSSMILMQLAVYQGYIKVDWRKVNKDLSKNAEKVKKEVQSHMTTDVSKKAFDVARENVVLAGTFLGGVLLGVASS